MVIDNLQYISKIEKFFVDVSGNPSEARCDHIPDREKAFIADIDRLVGKFMNQYFRTEVPDASQTDQSKFISLVEEILTVKSAKIEGGSLDVFYATTDHLGRDIRRFRYSEPSFKYVIDVYSNLDVRLSLSKIKRFWLTHVSSKLVKYNTEDVVSEIIYRIKLWTTPNSYYLLTLFTSKLNVSYSSDVEKARYLIGLPITCDPKERNSYERFDYDTRRALFNDVHHVQQEGFARRCIEARH